MTAQRLTSIIVVTYHTGPLLPKALEAILKQTADFELVLVNNGNSPKVEAAMMARFKDDPSVRLMTGHGNIGFARGYNLGARVASGDRLLFLSPYCLLPPDTVSRLFEQEQFVKKPYVLGARLVDQNGCEHKESRRALLTPKSLFFESLRLQKLFPSIPSELHKMPIPTKTTIVPAISRNFMYIPTKDFWHLNGFDEKYVLHGDDMEFAARFNQRGGVAYFVPDIVVKMCAPPMVATRESEKVKAKELVCYLEETFGDIYFHPALWALYLGIWGYFFTKMLGPILIEKAKKGLAERKAPPKPAQKR